jgi:hypothetical protein
MHIIQKQNLSNNIGCIKYDMKRDYWFYLTLGFLAEPPPALPFGLVSVVGPFLRLRPLLAAIGLS